MEWISVKDRLPEDAIRVLVAYNTGYVTIGRQYFGMWEGYHEGITHWMPLPPAPREKEKITMRYVEHGPFRLMGFFKED